MCKVYKYQYTKILSQLRVKTQSTDSAYICFTKYSAKVQVIDYLFKNSRIAIVVN